MTCRYAHLSRHYVTPPHGLWHASGHEAVHTARAYIEGLGDLINC
jgi:hypothetical protein